MRVTPLSIPDVIVLEPDAYGDERGFFYESYNCQKFTLATGREEEFVQDNHSQSALGVLRGLHYQIERTQAKLVRVAAERFSTLRLTCVKVRGVSGAG